MKKLPIVTAVLAGLAVVLFAFGAVLGAVVSKAQDADLYLAESRQAVADAFDLADDAAVTGYIGLTIDEQQSLAQRIAAGMRQEAMPDLAPLSDKEVQHMQDVHGLVHLADRLRAVLIAAAAGCCVAMAWTGADIERRRRTVLTGAACGLGVLIVIAVAAAVAMNTAGFAALFNGMHELLFTNDLWLLDPETDVLIRMMRQLLFERAAIDVLTKAIAGFIVSAVMGAAVYTILGGLMRRHFTEKKA